MANHSVVQDKIKYQPIQEQQNVQQNGYEVECPNCKSTFLHQQYNIRDASPIPCPLCTRTGLKNCAELLRHLRVVHVKAGSGEERGNLEVMGQKGGGRWKKIYKTIHERKKLPKKGDRVLAMWSQSKWEYFGATVIRFDADSMKYVVKWLHEEDEDGNISVEDIALDDILDDKEIGVGTLVLFRQGAYTSSHKQKDRNRGARRWHQGIITSVNKTKDGSKTYSGHHTKTDTDGKFVKYQNYSYIFNNLTKFDFRLAPNIFDVLHFSTATVELSPEQCFPVTDIDIYLSYDIMDSAHDIEAKKIDSSKIPESYSSSEYEKICDPVRIEDFLKSQGFSVCKQVSSNKENYDVKKVACLMKRAKVFIACLSDRYASNTQCCMEFQHAKVSLKKPVIPLVVGDGSFKWMTSVVGMLIAGELFIHYRNTEVETDKNAELLMNVRNHIPEVVTEKEQGFDKEDGHKSLNKVEHQRDKIKKKTTSKKTKAPPEIFLSYCWSNSHLAHEAKQIESLHGNAFSDPRLLKEKLEEAGYEVWLDIERLESANADAGLFGQIVQGVKSSLLVVSCISDEYANSQNCTMEFQFSVKSLSKPILPVVVGSGEHWKLSVIGCLLSTNDKGPINIQDVNNEDELDEKVSQIIREIESIIGKPRKKVLRNAERAKSDDGVVRKVNCSSSSSSSSSESSTDNEDEKDEKEEESDERLQPCYLASAPPSIRAPKMGDRVIGRYNSSLFAAALVVGANVRTLTYTLDWDNEELEQVSVVPYDQVALDEPVERDDIGVGMEIMFPHGHYFCNSCDENHERYFEGEITAITGEEDDGDGNISTPLVSGKKIPPSSMENLQGSDAYTNYFESVPIENIRLPPTAFDFLEMCVNEENEEDEAKKQRNSFFRFSSMFY